MRDRKQVVDGTTAGRRCRHCRDRGSANRSTVSTTGSERITINPLVNYLEGRAR